MSTEQEQIFHLQARIKELNGRIGSMQRQAFKVERANRAKAFQEVSRQLTVLGLFVSSEGEVREIGGGSSASKQIEYPPLTAAVPTYFHLAA